LPMLDRALPGSTENITTISGGKASADNQSTIFRLAWIGCIFIV
jgi:hypothetical protein